jgi:hypothetical protein
MTNTNSQKPESLPTDHQVLSCREAETLISEALDRRLQASLDRLLRKHIFSCPGCRKTYQDTLALQALVQGQPEDSVSPDFIDILEERIQAGEGTPPAALDAPIPLARKLKLFSSGMGTAAALLLSAWLVLDEISPPSSPNQPVVVQPGNQNLAANVHGGDNREGTSPIPIQSPFQETMRSINNGNQDFGQFPLTPEGRARPLTPLTKSSSSKSSPGLQPEKIGQFNQRRINQHQNPFPFQTPRTQTPTFPGALSSQVELVDPSRFALGLFKGTLKSLENLKANTERFQHFPPQKATEEILRSAEEARDCTRLLLKLDRRLIDLSPNNEAWLKKVHKQLQKVTDFGLKVKSQRKGMRESLQALRLMVKGIKTQDFTKTRITIRLKTEFNLGGSLLGTGMPPPSLQRVLRVLSRTTEDDGENPGSFFLFNGGDLRIFLIEGSKK